MWGLKPQNTILVLRAEENIHALNAENPSGTKQNTSLSMFSVLLTWDQPAVTCNTFTEQRRHFAWTDLS